MNTPRRIVVVEDEGIVALDIARQLRSFGYEVAGVFASAEDLFTSFGKLLPDLVLLDIELAGEMDGLDAASIIRHEHGLPVILLTAYSDEGTIERAKDSDPFAYIIKPFEGRELRTQVALALHRHEVEQKLAEKERELRRSQKLELVGRITGGVAHDFNNLLTVILGYSKLISKEAKRYPDSGSVLRNVEGIRSAALKSAGLTRQLLAFSRRQPLKPLPVDLNRVFGEIEPILRGLLSERIDVRMQLYPGLRTVVIDPGLVEQVVMNLVLNARDAMPNGGALVLRSSVVQQTEPSSSLVGAVEPGEYGVISVEDSGSGIPHSSIDEIFEPFFTTKAEGDGVGLGLSTVYGIVKQLGGHLFVSSTEDVGTRFDVWFKCSELASEDNDNSVLESDSLQCSGGSETLLVLEEDDPLRTLMADALSGLGYKVIECKNAGEALLCVEEQGRGIDAVILGVILSHVTPKRFVERLRGLDSKLLFLLTGTPGTPGVPENAAFLAKPFEIESLCGAVRRLLDYGPSAAEL